MDTVEPMQHQLVIDRRVQAQNLVAEPSRDVDRPEQGGQKMTLGEADPCGMLKHLTGGTGDQIYPRIVGMGDGVPHPFVQAAGLFNVIRKRPGQMEGGLLHDGCLPIHHRV